MIAPDASFRGLTNQLYRVEIHAGGKVTEATFKWSRENGSVTAAIVSLAGDEVIVDSLGRDYRLAFNVGDYVEVVDDDYALNGRTAPLIRIKEVEPLDQRIVLDRAPAGGVGQNPDRHPFLRRWDQAGPTAKGDQSHYGPDKALKVVETTNDKDNWIELEDGVQVQFHKDGNYRPGDFWLIPARVMTGDVEWPGPLGDPKYLEPFGIDYYYAPLALVIGTGPHDAKSMQKFIDAQARP